MNIRILISGLFATLLFSACSTPMAPSAKTELPPANASSQKLYQEAQNFFDHGQDDAATQKIKNLLQKEPSTDLTDDSLLLLGRIEFRRKQFQNAYNHFEQIFSSTFRSPREIEARILGVQCLLAMEKNEPADRLIRNSLQLPLQPRERAYLLEAQLPILLKRDAQLESFEALAYLAQHHPNSNSRDKYKETANDFIDSRLKPADLKDISEDSEMGEFRVEAMFQYALDLVEENKLDQAKSYFSRITALAPGTYLAQQSANMVKQLEARSFVETKSIGAVLPLSGPYASIGQQTLHGLQLALGISGTQSKNNIRLVVQDSMGTPEDASRAVENLIYKDHVMAIVGGLSAKTVTAEATRAQELGVPFIGLSQKSDLTKIGPFIFTNSITPKLQVEYLVAYAMERLKAKRFAIIYPNDRYGVEFANIFWDEVLRRGGKLTTAQVYNPGETDFKAHVKKMVETYYIEDRAQEFQGLLTEWKKKNKSARKQPPETLLPPIINFDVLFIPDDPKALGQIAPMLAFNDVTNIYLLGTNLWNSPEFLNRAQSFAERSVFVDSHLGNSPDYLESAFYKEFRALYKERPGSFAIQGFDAGKLVLNAIKESPRNRIDFLRLMATADKVPGAISVLRMSPDREVERRLLPLMVKKNEFVIAE